MKIEELRKRAEETKERLRLLNEIYEAECLMRMIAENRELVKMVDAAREVARLAKIEAAEAREVLRRTLEESRAKSA